MEEMTKGIRSGGGSMMKFFQDVHMHLVGRMEKSVRFSVLDIFTQATAEGLEKPIPQVLNWNVNGIFQGN